jgi:hypothetical protein
MLESWGETTQRLKLDLEGSARETGALERRREIRSASDLLRIIFMYVVSDWSFRLVGAWVLLQGLGNLSDVAILKRFRGSRLWLGVLVGQLLQRRCRALLAMGGVRVRLMDMRPSSTVLEFTARTGGCT